MHGTNRDVLHVDDDPQLTRLVKTRLASYGIRTCPLNDPRECLDRVIHDGYRLVLLDIDMPEVDGLQLLEQIKRHDGGVQVIMLTGLVTMAATLRSFRLGAEACLFKPLDDFGPLAEAIHGTFRKIDRWWETLSQLSSRRHGETPATAALVDALSGGHPAAGNATAASAEGRP